MQLSRFSQPAFGYPSPSYFRQRVPYVLVHHFLLPRRDVYDIRANRVRLPELDEKAVEVHPLHISLLVTDGGGVGVAMN